MDSTNLPSNDDEQFEDGEQGFFFPLYGGARQFNESDTQQQEALLILRHRPLTKVSFEKDMKNGSRLAPAIDILRNGWGFKIAGTGTSKNPYTLLDKNQSPTRVRTTEELKSLYYDSKHWHDVRLRRFEHDNHRCVLCVSTCRDGIQCHHFTYNLFNEKLDELITVCRAHHEMIHDKDKGCFLKFPTGVDLWVAEELLGVVAYKFEEWLLP